MVTQHPAGRRGAVSRVEACAAALVLLTGAGWARGATLPLSGVKSVSVGAFSACAVVGDDGSGATARCWGNNAFGQLGNNSTNSNGLAVAVLDNGGITAITVGEAFACALHADGVPVCWGANDHGQTGVFGAGSLVPVAVNGAGGGIGGPALAVSAGFQHACALRKDGIVLCWGDNGSGQLGDGTAGGVSAAPVQVSGISGAVAIAAGGLHTCALLAGGAVECWGSNNYGQLGNGSKTSSAIPVAVNGLPGPASQISAGYTHACAISGAIVYCWGRNLDGQLGSGPPGTASSIPVPINGLSAAKAIAAGGEHTCGDFASGVTYCWGNNQEGELGNNAAPNDSTSPVAVTGLAGANAIAAGLTGNCAALVDKTARCWGSGYVLGNGNTDARVGSAVPVTVLVQAAATFTVTPVAGPHGSISPAAAQTVAGGASVSFTITPDPGYTTSVGGDCSGTLNGSTQAAAIYAIAAVNADCTLNVKFNPIYHTVTPSAGPGGSITPSTPQAVPYGASSTFSLIPDPGYVAAIIIGTCSGTLQGNTFTTAPVVIDCSVIAGFAPAPPAAQSVAAPMLNPSASICLVLLLAYGAWLGARSLRSHSG